MSAIVSIIVVIHPAAGKKEQVQKTLLSLAAKVKENEPDCLEYSFYSNENSNEIVAVEKFRSMEALQAHGKMPYVEEYKKQGEAENVLEKPTEIRVLSGTGGFARAMAGGEKF